MKNINDFRERVKFEMSLRNRVRFQIENKPRRYFSLK
jgi:hypothetical protein